MRRRLVLRFVPLVGALVLVATGVVARSQEAKPIVKDHVSHVADGVVSTGWSRVVHSDDPAEMVGFDWDGRGDATLTYRFRANGEWSNWTTAEGEPSEGPDSTSREHHDRVSAGPFWLGHDVHDVEVRVARGDVPRLRVHSIHTTDGSRGPFSAAVASAEPGWPNVISRAGWGADESWRSRNPGCGTPDYASTVRYAVLHHTDNSNAYNAGDVPSIIRGIYQFHVFTNGWCDIGYNFLVDRFGRSWEGRFGGVGEAVIGAHAGGFNTESTGVAIIGTFQSTPVPSSAYNGVRALLSWKLAHHGVDPTRQITVTAGSFDGSNYPAGSLVNVSTVTGHRDLDSTDCPGNFGEDILGSLRNDVQYNIQSTSSFAGWDGLQGIVANGPDLSSWGPGRLDLFARGASDSQLWHRWFGGGWSAWEPLGAPPGGLTSAPTAVSWGPGRIDVFARGSDNALWHKWFENAWSGWESLGGGLGGGADVSSWGPGRLDAFVRGSDNALYHKWFDASGWHGWENLAGGLTSDPGAVSWSPGRIDVFVRGGDNATYHRWFDGSWHWWESLGGGLNGGIDVSSWAPGRLDLFARGSDDGLWHKWFENGWSGWEKLGDNLGGDPAAVSWSPNRIDVAVLGVDGGTWHKWWGGGWNP